MPYSFVDVRSFTPNTPQSGVWQAVGAIAGCVTNGATVTLQAAPNADGSPRPAPILTFLSPTAFRLRFNPLNNYAQDGSYAVVNPALGAVAIPMNVAQTPATITINTGVIQVVITKAPYALSVIRNGQVIHADTPDYNLIYIPGQEVIANLKVLPANALCFGFGEKAGATLAKNNFTMTFFNYDNFSYIKGPLPSPPPEDDGGPLNPSEALYCSVPFLIETNPQPANGPAYSYGLFFDNPAQSYFNISANDYSDMTGKYYFGALYGDLNYYFFYGDDVPAVLTQYCTLTGFPPMPPRYVFGFHQGGYGYYDQQRVTGVANDYRDANFPIDGLHIDVDFQDNYRTFTSSNLKFPNANTMFASLHSRGFKASANTTPLVTTFPVDETGNQTPYDTLTTGLTIGGAANGAFIPDPTVPSGLFLGTVNYGSNPGSNPFKAFPLPPPPADPIIGAPLGADGHYPDFGRADVRAWWGQQYNYLINTVGLDMVWQDMTCPALSGTTAATFPLDLKMTDIHGNMVENARMHNGYVMQLLAATYAGLQALRPNQRNFIIARGGYAGVQRYAGLWTGDSASSWDFLQINIPEVLNMGLSGIPIAGCDIGGFAVGSGSTAPYPNQAPLVGGVGGQIQGCIANYELLTRWMQVGSFLPWFRNHYNGYAKQFQEPIYYGEPVPTNCKKYVDLRYRMLHIYYTAMYEATQTGMPIARPLFLNDPDDPQVYQHLDDQFFVGRDFLVAPILFPHETANPPSPQGVRSVYLPAGSDWYAFQDNKAPLVGPNQGGSLITWQAGLDLVPIYVRAGAILPFRESEQYVGQLSPNPITFNIYPGPDTSTTLYQDDGISAQAAPANAVYRLTEISHAALPGGGISARIQRLHDNYAPPEPFYYVAILGQAAPPAAVTAAGAALTDAQDSTVLASSPVNAYYYNASIQITFLKIFDTVNDITLQIV